MLSEVEYFTRLIDYVSGALAFDLPFPFPLLGLAKREGLISSSCFPFTENSR